MDNHNKLSESLFINSDGRLTDIGLEKQLYITGLTELDKGATLKEVTIISTTKIVCSVNLDLIFKA